MDEKQFPSSCPPPIPSNAVNLTPWTKSNFLAVELSGHPEPLVSKTRPAFLNDRSHRGAAGFACEKQDKDSPLPPLIDITFDATA
jgi:hypothetical protein